MSSYEFWDELGKIFNAVVAYQEKNLEFNKRFINPWIRLGNVFDKQDRNKEAVGAFEKAIELDPENAQNWFELGNIHFKMGDHAKAVEAFNKAIELDPGSGWSYTNLALTLVAQGSFERAIPLYQKGIELLQEDKDKAVAWNRLGNVYRKLNQYDLALEAFHKADELDRDNAGFRDNLDEVSEGPTLVQSTGDGTPDLATTLTVSPIELIVADSRAEEDAARAAEAGAGGGDAATEAPTVPQEASSSEPTAKAQTSPVSSESGQGEAAPDAAQSESPTQAASSGAAEDAAEASPAAEPPDASVTAAEVPVQPEIEAQAAVQGEQTVTVVVQDTIETFTETLTSTAAPGEAAETKPGPEAGKDDASPTAEMHAASADASAAADAGTTEVVQSDPEVEPAQAEAALPQDDASQAPAESTLDATQPTAAVVAGKEETLAAASTDATAESTSPTQAAEAPVAARAEAANTQEEGPLDNPEHVAYEEFLKDTNEPIHIYEPDPGEEQEVPGPQEPVAKIDPSGELQIEMDTKNAHVWNELGNVYFNTSAFDDAIVAYSKAIELDRWFAWPYSNLALAYVQKRRFVEAILLYQRSIELFTGEKDKAISWNRLGNVYRRLNDYENAIAAYQRADELDPENTTLSLQSRFSLLGSYALEQKPSYVS